MAEFESDFWHPKVATDIVLLTIREKKLNILLVKRKKGKEGLWLYQEVILIRAKI